MKAAADPISSSVQTLTLTADSQLMQDYLQSTGILVSTSASPAVAAFQNNDGDSEAVVIDVNGNLQHVCREALSDSGWNMYGLGAGFRAIAPVDSATLWAIGLIDDAFWQNNHGRWTQFQIPLPSGATAMQISAGTDGTIWTLDDQGNAYAMGSSLSTGSAWSALNGPALKHPPTGAGNACWAIDNNGAVINWNGAQWSTVALPQSQPASWVSVGSDGTLWALDTSGVLYQYVNSVFQAMAGALPGVGYFSASSAASLWATAATNPADLQGDYSLFQFTDGTWQSMHSPPLSYGDENPPQVSVGAEGSVCLLDSGTGTVWRQSISGWTPKKMSVNVQSIAAEGAATGAAWAVDADGTFWRNFGSRWVNGQPSLPNAAKASQVSVGTDGTVWALDMARNLYVKNGLSWSQLSASTFPQQPPSGSADNCWTIDYAGELLVSNGSEWDVVRLPDNAAKATFVSVGTDGSVWVVVTGGSGGSANTCYQYLSGAWQEAGGNFAQAPVGRTNDLWCVTSTGAVCHSGDAGQTWSIDNTAPAAIKRLAVGPDGSVWALDTSGTAWMNPSWQRLMRPTGMTGWSEASNCASVAAGRDEDGMRYVFFIDRNGGLNYTVEVLPHTWIDPLQLVDQGVSNLGLTNRQDTGELIVYGIAGSSLVVAAKSDRSDPTSFVASNLSPSFGPPGQPLGALSSIEFSAVNASDWYWFSLLGSNASPAYPAGSLIMAASHPPDNRVQFWPVANSPTQTVPGGLTRLVSLPWRLQSGQSPCAVIMDGNQQIQVVSVVPTLTGAEFAGSFLLLTGSGTFLSTDVTAVAAVLQSESGSLPQPRLYATAPITSGGTTTALWMLQQIDASVPVSQSAAWSPWIPLGGSYAVLTTGPSSLDTETLFAVGTDGSLHSISQDAVTGKWTDLEVNRPSVAGVEMDTVAMYQTQITLTDQNGVPQGNVPVTITAESPVTVWVENTLCAIDADQGVTWNTDATGKIYIRTLATDLHAPSLTFQADGLPAGTQSVYPAQHVHDFLAGTGQLAVGGGQPTNFTADALQAQWPKVQPAPPNNSYDNAVTNAKQIAAMTKSAPSRGATIAGWAADLSDPAHPRFQTFSTSEALADYRRQLDQRLEAGLPGLLDSWWDHVKHAAEDIVHAIKKDAMRVDTLTVDTVNQAVYLTLYVGDLLVGTFELVVKTVEDAIHAIEVVLKTFVADIEEIIEWLMLLFKWEDIWATKEKLEGFLLQALSIGQDQIGALRSAAEGLFTSIKDTFSADFDTMIATLQSGSFPYKTFADLPQWPSASTTVAGAALHQSALGSLQSPGSIVHSTWLLSKVLRNITPSLNFGPAASINLAGLINAMNAPALVEDLKQATTDFENYFMDVFKDPEQFAQRTIVAVLQEVKDLLLALLDSLDGLAQAFLDLVEQMLGIMNGWFNQHLDIPVISPLYKFITTLLGTSESLTILHLFALLTAVPLTIIHKLLFNGQKPYDGIDVAALRPSAGHAPVGASETEAAKWNQSYLVTGIVYSGAVALVDGLIMVQRPADPPTPPIRIATSFSRSLTDILGMVQRINCWPGMFPNLPHPENATAGWLLANWCIYWFPPNVDAAFNPNDVPDVRIACLTVLGIAASISAAVTMDSLNDYLAAQTVIQPWPLILSFMMSPEVRTTVIESTDGLGDSAYLKLVADMLINLGVSTLHYAGNS